ncbi:MULTISPECIES: hypothetical protein [unclassified Ligilactobacillus]|uniref:hypothetical protein n=1 Tax=unclassified Ligilactobacillus TaxID=2767920 RepID=UPI0038532DBF
MYKVRFVKWGEITRRGSKKNERTLVSFDLKEHKFVKRKNNFKGQRTEDVVVAALLVTFLLGSFDHISDIPMRIHWLIGVVVGLMGICAFHFKHQNNPNDFENISSEKIVKDANKTLIRAIGLLVAIDVLIIALYFLKKCLGTCLLVYFAIFITAVFVLTYIEMGYVWIKYVRPHKYKI